MKRLGHAPPPVLCRRPLTAGLGLSIRVFIFPSHHSTPESCFTEIDCSDFRGIQASFPVFHEHSEYQDDTSVPSNEGTVDANLKTASNSSQPCVTQCIYANVTHCSTEPEPWKCSAITALNYSMNRLPIPQKNPLNPKSVEGSKKSIDWTIISYLST